MTDLSSTSRPATVRRGLIASIHDVAPRFEGQVDLLHDRLARHVGADRQAMLVVPEHWASARLVAGTPFAARLRRWAEGGIEMFVHGWYHRDDSSHEGAVARFRAKRMTAGEGEFLGLAHGEAARRMADGRALIEDIIGRSVTGFIAPAWLYGPGAQAALAEAGFALAEDHMRVWQPATGAVLATGPVVTWASRSGARIVSSLAFAAIARVALGRQRIVRLAVHPGDTGVPALLESIDRTAARFARSHGAIRYADLAA